VTDVVPLPPSDPGGGTVGLLIQALAVGATIASIGLGRLGSRETASWLRGIGHLIIVLLDALVSAAVVLWVASWFDVIPSSTWGLFGSLTLISHAITASAAAFVSLIGPAGALIGTLYSHSA
jgi:hypothetical protein